MRRSALLLIAALCGCASPFSDFQTAHVLDRGEVAVTPYYSSQSLFSEGDSGRLQSGYGLMAGAGIGSPYRADLRLRYERIVLDEVDGEFNVVGFGPKFRAGSDAAALYLPVGFAFGGDIETSSTWETQPTFLVTDAITSWWENTASAKVLLRLSDEANPRFAFGLGADLGPDRRRFAVHPELGILFDPGVDGFQYHLGIGLSVGFGEAGPAVDPRPDGRFSFEALHLEERGDVIEVSGRVVNRTGTDHDRAAFTILCCDRVGGVLATTQIELEDFGDGETRPFSATVARPDSGRAVQCRMRFAGER